MRLAVFLTWDVSLAVWEQKGLLLREMLLYEKLAAQGIDITLLTWGDVADADIGARYPFVKTIPIYTRLPRFSFKTMRFLSSFFAPLFFIKDLSDADVLKTNQMWGAWAPVIAKYIFGKKLILRTGYELYDFTMRGGYSRARRRFIQAISFFCYNAADQIFLATKNDADFVEKTFRIRREKIKICPNWIDTSLFFPNESVQKNGRVLYVGRLTAQKNLSALIEAIAATGYALDLVGAGELEQTLRDMAKKTGADVVFHGAVANVELPNMYRCCSVYVLPSFYEGNPKTLLEAMACGAPVVCTDVPGIRDIVDDQATGYLCGTSSKEIADALRCVMNDPSFQKPMGKAAREAILAHNTLDAQVAREVQSVRALSAK